MQFIEEQFIRLQGTEGSIELAVSMIYDDGSHMLPDQTWDQDLKGSLRIKMGCMQLKQPEFYSSLGALRRLLRELEECAHTLSGTAVFEQAYEADLCFQVEMREHGHVQITGRYQEQAPSGNQLCFQMESDQTCIAQTILDLKRFENALCDATQVIDSSDQ